ncbi:MAG: hypothetical protein LBC80_02860 [Treponema sp.]|nr:hypothetical protein [Treponema sp.]
MKKVLVILLVLAVAGAAFADVTSYGRARLNLGSRIILEPDNADPSWIFIPHFRMGVRGSNDVVRFFAQFDANTNDANAHVFGTWRANASVDIGDLTLSLGRNELPWVQWSSLAFLGDTNSSFGATNSTVVGYVQVAHSGAYLGLTSAGRIHEKTTEDYPAPGFYLGYDHKADGFSVGGAFAGLAGTHATPARAAIHGCDDCGVACILAVPRGEPYDVFSWMGKVHAKFDVAPAIIGVNIALYGAPMYGFFSLTPVNSIIGGDKALVLESMLDIAVRLEPCAISLTTAYVANFADNNDRGGGSALRIGTSANFDVGGGFRVIPGLMYTNFLKGAGGGKVENSDLQVGVTFLYSF